VAELFAASEAGRRRPRFTGTWTTTFGTLTISQEGDVATGTYPHKGGLIQGEQDGRVLRGRWFEPEHEKEGTFELTIDAAGNSFNGSWSYADSARKDGDWHGARLELPSEEEGGNPGGWNSYTEGPLLAGPMLGEAGETDARVWVQARDTTPLTLSIFQSDGSESRTSFTPEWSEWLCGSIHVTGLVPGERYKYEISSENGVTDRFELRAAPPSSARRLKIAFGSCFWDYPNDRTTIFDAIAREDADVFLMIGDTSYCGGLDSASEHTFMLTHLRHRNNDAIRSLLPNVPVLGVWDDHDYGPGDADGTFEGKVTSLRAFKRCWGQATYGLPDTPGVFSTVRVGPAEIFLPDSRYYKGLGKRILGPAQLAWMLARLEASDAPVKIIACPTQVLPEHPVINAWDCFRRDAPEELEELLATIASNDIRGVVFVSGDLHMANLIHVAGEERGGRRGPELWELTSSPLANSPWNEPQMGKGTDRYLVSEVHDRTNYGVIDIDLDRSCEEIALILKNDGGAPFFRQPIALDDLRVR
jgi:alkaline phosphatase D